MQLVAAFALASIYQATAFALAALLMPHLNIHGSGALNELGLILLLILSLPGILLGSVIPDSWDYGGLAIIGAVNVVTFAAIGFVWLRSRARGRRGLTSA